MRAPKENQIKKNRQNFFMKKLMTLGFLNNLNYMVLGSTYYDFYFSEFFQEFFPESAETQKVENTDILLIVGPMNNVLSDKVIDLQDKLPDYSKIIRIHPQSDAKTSSLININYDIQTESIDNSMLKTAIDQAISDIKKDFM